MDDADPHPHAAPKTVAMATAAKNRSQGIRCWQETRGEDVKTLVIADAGAAGIRNFIHFCDVHRQPWVGHYSRLKEAVVDQLELLHRLVCLFASLTQD